MSEVLLARIASELEVLDRRRYRVADMTREFSQSLGSREQEGPGWTRLAGDALGRVIYQVYYLGKPLSNTEGERALGVFQREHPAFGETLRNANTGKGWSSRGWTLVGMTDMWEVERDGIHLHAKPSQVISEQPTPRLGDEVQVQFPKHFPYQSPGYYTAVGNAGPPHTQIQRIYLNVRAEAAATLFAAITTRLNDAGLPFLSKIVNHPLQFDRPDACTCYLQREHVVDHRAALSELFSGQASALRPESPGFAYQWMPGVALAQEPPPAVGTVRSFGEHRCQIVGRAVASAYVEGQSRREAIWDCLYAEGLNPAALHLNPNERCPLTGVAA